MRVLVTGASGFSGSYVAAAFAQKGFDVTGLYRSALRFAASHEGLRGLTLIHTDLARVADLTGPFEAIVHTAATSPGSGITEADIVRDNADATRGLVEAAERLGCRRFIYFSSLSIYGDISVPVVDENTPILNPDAYGRTKWAGEQMLMDHADTLPSLSLRLPGVLGRGAHRNWMSSVASRLEAGAAIPAFNLESSFNNACHVADLTTFVSALVEMEWEGADAVVLGARRTITVRRAIERLAIGMGVKPIIKEVPAPKPSFILASDKALEQWGYQPMEIGEMIDRYAREV